MEVTRASVEYIKKLILDKTSKLSEVTILVTPYGVQGHVTCDEKDLKHVIGKGGIMANRLRKEVSNWGKEKGIKLSIFIKANKYKEDITIT